MLRIAELSVDDFLDRLLFEKVQIGEAVIEELGDEEVVDVVELLWLLVDPAQILGVIERARLPLHEQVDLDFVDQRDEIYEGVLDVYAGFGWDVLLVFDKQLELLHPIALIINKALHQKRFYLLSHVESAFEIFDER